MTLEEEKTAKNLVRDYFKRNVFVGIEFSGNIENDGVRGKFWITNKKVGASLEVTRLIPLKNFIEKEVKKESEKFATVLLDHIFLNASLYNKLRMSFFRRFIFLFTNE